MLPVDVGLPAAVDALRADPTHGRLLDDGGLMPTADGLRIRTSAGSVTELDGPFAEAKEVVGGFFVVESPSAGAMATWARSFVDLHAQHWPELSYTAEVRPDRRPATVT